MLQQSLSEGKILTATEMAVLGRAAEAENAAAARTAAAPPSTPPAEWSHLGRRQQKLLEDGVGRLGAGADWAGIGGIEEQARHRRSMKRSESSTKPALTNAAGQEMAAKVVAMLASGSASGGGGGGERPASASSALLRTPARRPSVRTSTGSAATPARPASAPGGRGAAAARWGAARRGAQRQAAARKRWAGMLGTARKLPPALLMAQTIDLWATRRPNERRILCCAGCAATHVNFSADGNMQLVAGMTRHLHDL